MFRLVTLQTLPYYRYILSLSMTSKPLILLWSRIYMRFPKEGNWVIFHTLSSTSTLVVESLFNLNDSMGVSGQVTKEGNWVIFHTSSSTLAIVVESLFNSNDSMRVSGQVRGVLSWLNLRIVKSVWTQLKLNRFSNRIWLLYSIYIQSWISCNPPSLTLLKINYKLAFIGKVVAKKITTRRFEIYLGFWKEKKKKKSVHDGTRTHNLPLRRRAPYPLGHANCLLKKAQ